MVGQIVRELFTIKMTRTIFLILLSLIVVGCTTTNDAMRKTSYYYGKSADDFFRNNGMPLQAYKFDKGDRMYRWSSIAHSVVMPGFTNYSGSVGPFGQVTGSAVSSGGFAINVQCVVDIHADQNNNILKITPVVDTWGDWETSRCNEILK
jgi:hypothetical protein